MSDFRTRWVFGIAWLLLWLLLVAVAIQEYWREGGMAFWPPLLWESSSVIVSGALLLVQRHFTRPRDHLLASPKRWFALQFCWLPFNCIAFVPLTFGLRHAVYAALGQVYHHQPWATLFLYESIKVSLLFAIFNVVLFGFLSWQQLLQEKERAQAANELLRQAQLQQLTQQMQPHFLFNALNTISSLMYSDVEKADAILIQLADVLRATLAVSEQQQVPLATELRLLRGYAALMCERFIDRVEIQWQVDEATLGVLVPVMSLQPLLENIFKHTVETCRQRTKIRIGAQQVAAQLCLTLEDDQGILAQRAVDGGKGSTGNPGGTGGIGLKNIHARLQVLHGANASLILTQLTPAGVRAQLCLPWSEHADSDR